jgi:hypothetical protein
MRQWYRVFRGAALFCGLCVHVGCSTAPPEMINQTRLYCRRHSHALKRPQAGTAAGLHALLPALFDKAFKGEL